jgi:hypothetical protein
MRPQAASADDDDADELTGSIWDASLDLFGGSSALTALLREGACRVEPLMLEDEFIQEAQGHNGALTALLTARAGLHSLLFYLVTPQHPRAPDRAFRFPFMAAEAFACRTDALLDALVARGGGGLEHLFSAVVPRLRDAAHAAAADVDTADACGPGWPLADPLAHARAYLTGYWVKVQRADGGPRVARPAGALLQHWPRPRSLRRS